MRHPTALRGVVALCAGMILTAACEVRAQEAREGDAAETARASAPVEAQSAPVERSIRPFEVELPVYVPPPRSAPGTRIGAATRGLGLRLHALVPEHAGVTHLTQPRVYWFAAQPVDGSVEFALTHPDAVDPVLVVELPGPFGSGVHSVDLEDLGFRLKLGVTYSWVVTVLDVSGRRTATHTGGGIELRPMDEALAAEVAEALEPRVLHVYARAGSWYEAVADVSRRIDETPGDSELRSQRAALLEQVGLPDIAAYDRDAAR